MYWGYAIVLLLLELYYISLPLFFGRPLTVVLSGSLASLFAVYMLYDVN